MSRLMKASSNTFRVVGPGVGSREVVGASEPVGVTDGGTETEGERLGFSDGIFESDG